MILRLEIKHSELIVKNYCHFAFSNKIKTLIKFQNYCLMQLSFSNKPEFKKDRLFANLR